MPITSLRKDGPDPHGDTPMVRLVWEQSKQIVDLLNAREAERRAIVAKDIAAGRLSKAPKGLDVGAMTILTGVLSAVIADCKDAPDALAGAIRILAGYICPPGVSGPFLLAVAFKEIEMNGATVTNRDESDFEDLLRSLKPTIN